jgi:polysaccharide pyruvyl transferase WcaK-like protein
MDFYLTGRYHSVSSALYMAVPVVSLSWHVKYEDIMSLFFEGPPVINCRKKSVEESFSIIKKYYFNRSWFNREKILGEREKVLKKIDRSIYLLVRQIEKYYEQKMIGSKRGKR